MQQRLTKEPMEATVKSFVLSENTIFVAAISSVQFRRHQQSGREKIVAENRLCFSCFDAESTEYFPQKSEPVIGA